MTHDVVTNLGLLETVIKQNFTNHNVGGAGVVQRPRGYAEGAHVGMQRAPTFVSEGAHVGMQRAPMFVSEGAHVGSRGRPQG